MNNKNLVIGFVGGLFVGGAIMWAYMYRITKIAFNNALKMANEDTNDISEPTKEEPRNETPPEKSEEKEEDMQFIPFDKNEKPERKSKPYIVSMEEADSDEVINYGHMVLYYIVEDGILMDSDGDSYKTVEDVGEENLSVLGPDCEDIMIRNDDTKTIYEVCVSAYPGPEYEIEFGDEE